MNTRYIAVSNRAARLGITQSRIKSLLWGALRFALLFGLGFIIVYPFFAKISSMFMSTGDLRDPIVWFVPRNPTLDNIKNVVKYGRYWQALKNTFITALICSVLQTVSCTFTAYGLGRFRFWGRRILFLLAVLTIVIPPQVVYISLYIKFRFFDVFGILGALGLPQVNLLETLTPLTVLSAGALGLKNGLYILILTQFFAGLPKELSEAACVDGAGIFKTFYKINMPQARAIMVSVFLLSFAWQWTETFYSGLFFRSMPTLPNVIEAVRTISGIGANSANMLSATMVNTAVIMVIFPLVLIYIFGQRYIIQGIENSGLVG